VSIDVGPEPRDVNDAASDQLLLSDVAGAAQFSIPADSARVIVLVPADSELRREGKKTLVGDVVVRY
jgi:hypothetical protein